MKRTTTTQEGFDCRNGHEASQGNHGREGRTFAPGSKCEFGCAGDTWIYSVAEKDAATRLTVYTDNLRGVPNGLHMPPDLRGARGADLTLHVAWPTDRERLRGGDGMEPCDLVASGRCSCPFETCLGAGELFAEHGSQGGPKQPVALWRALEEWHRAHVDKARSLRVDLEFIRCPRCGGDGIVQRDAKP